MTSTSPLSGGAPVSPESGHGHVNHNLTGFIIFLCSESVIFLAFFSGYAILRTSALDWLPPGVDGLEWRTPLVNTAVLISSSGTIMLAEHFKAREKIWLFRGFWLLTMAMGGYFLVGQAVEWSGLAFGFSSGTFGGTFYLLTGVVAVFAKQVDIGDVLIRQRHRSTALQQQHRLAGCRQLAHQGAATGTAADHDHVVMLVVDDHRQT